MQPGLKYIGDLKGDLDGPDQPTSFGSSTSRLYQSEGHPINRKTGIRESGGPFHVVHSGVFANLGTVRNIVRRDLEFEYSGPVFMNLTKHPEIYPMYKGSLGDRDLSELDADGATAISRVSPVNPTASLGVTLGEFRREGFPTLPGIQSWKHRVGAARSAGSEYLNAVFGWKPLTSEIQNVAGAARNHRDVMSNYARNEGTNIHRRFDFSPEISRTEAEVGGGNPITGILSTQWLSADPNPTVVTVHHEVVRKRWFEGCFTYGGPGKVDNFNRHLEFGKKADAIYGLNLTPDLVWNLTPWSWAVDWFTNAGDVISNVTAFANAGLVMRYGYMMEETIETYSMNWSDGPFLVKGNKPGFTRRVRTGAGSRGYKTVRKSRSPANPFGFGVAWEGLSPTQLAITAAIGITRLP